MDIIENNGLEDYEADEVARVLQRTLKEKQELIDLEKLCRERLAQLALDQEGRLLVTAYGTYKARKKKPYLRWDRDRITETVYTLAKRGEFAEPNKEGELPSVEFMVYDALKTAFRFEPRVSEIKKMDLDPDEYSESDGIEVWDIQVIS